MTQKHRIVLLLGAPGTGKGTQGKIVGEVPGFFHLAVGEMFRTMGAAGKLSQDVRDTISRGELVSDAQVIDLWREYLTGTIPQRGYRPGEQILLLDGMPRTVEQARAIDEDGEVLLAIHLVAYDEPALIERLKRRASKENRADDAREDVIRHRLEVYHAETAPALEHYPPNRVAKIDAIGTPLEVLRRVVDVLLPLRVG